MAGSRPVFPFDEALVVARNLQGLAEFASQHGGSRATTRTELLQSWRGGHADTFAASHGSPEDEQLANAATELGANAEEWATQWALAVNDTNAVTYDEAVEEAERLNAARQSAWGYAMRSYYARAAEAASNDQVFYASPPRRPDDIVVDPLPDNVTAPSSPGFSGGSAPFAVYAYDGGARMAVSTAGSPPA